MSEGTAAYVVKRNDPFRPEVDRRQQDRREEDRRRNYDERIRANWRKPHDPEMAAAVRALIKRDAQAQLKAPPVMTERDAANLTTHLYLSAVDCAACRKAVYEWPGKPLQRCPNCGEWLDAAGPVRDVRKLVVLDPVTGVVEIRD